MQEGKGALAGMGDALKAAPESSHGFFHAIWTSVQVGSSGSGDGFRFR